MTNPPASFKTMILGKTIKRADAMKIAYGRIHVKVDFNLRELDAQYEAGIEDLTAYIMSGGILPPWEVVPLPDGSGVELVDGHRRYEAYGRAITRGFPIEWISIVAFQGNETDRQARIYTSNKNAPLRPPGGRARLQALPRRRPGQRRNRRHCALQPYARRKLPCAGRRRTRRARTRPVLPSRR